MPLIFFPNLLFPLCYTLFTISAVSYFLLLIKEYTRQPPSETNTSPMIIISTIPISLSLPAA